MSRYWSVSSEFSTVPFGKILQNTFTESRFHRFFPFSVEKKVFDKITQMKFEDGVYNVPGDWDLYLKTLYGDYMTPKKY